MSASADDRRADAFGAAPRRRRAALVRLLPVAMSGLVGGMAIALVGGFVLFAQMVSAMEQPAAPGDADAIVALTGGAARIDDAVDLMNHGRAARLLITGVHADTTPEALARYSPGLVPLLECCVDLGYEALNTVGNAKEARNWVHSKGYRSLIVVTSDYHLPRSLNELRREMPDVQLIPYPVIKDRVAFDRWWRDRDTARLLVGEYAKYLMSMVQLRWRPATTWDTGVAAAQTAD